MVINGRLYIFSNLCPETAARRESTQIVKIVDFNLYRIFGVELWNSKPENRPSSIRVNYSLALYKFKVYLYGGLNS